jgi:hypothetical protein
VVINGATVLLSGLGSDVSENGLRAFVLGPIASGQPVELNLMLPTGKLKLKAKVQFAMGHDCGFEFTGLREDQQMQIRKATERLEPLRT